MKTISQLVKEAMAGAHSPLGASAADRWITCPGSVGATIELMDVDTQYSLEGTAAHFLAEHCNEFDLKTIQYPNKEISVKKVDDSITFIPCDKTMRDGVQAFLDFVNELPGDDYNEERVHWHQYVPNAFGTMDRARATDKKLRIIDLKYGEGWQVFAENNPQLMLYALGFLEKYGWMYDIEEIELIIFQPRLDHIDRWTTTVAELEKWAREVMQPAAELAQTAGAPFNAGTHCKFCKLRGNCAARAKYVFDGAVGEMENFDDQIGRQLRNPHRLTGEQMSKILGRKTQVTAFYTELERYAMQELAHGRAIGEWKIVEGRSNRAWGVSQSDVLEAIRTVEIDGKPLKLDTKQLWTEPTLISPTAAEGVFGKKLFEPTRTTEAGRVIPGGPLARLITKPRGAPKLAPGYDKRPRLTVEANEMDDLGGGDEL